MTHRELEAMVREYLELRGCLVISTHDARHRPAEAGVPDLIAIHNGRVLFVEVKAGADKQRPQQIAFAERAVRAGAQIVLARALEDVILALAA